jgi:hypothetical protein
MRRRRLLAALGATGIGAGCTSVLGDAAEIAGAPPDVGLAPVGHALLSTPGEYAEGALGPEGRYAAVGSHDGHGTFLVDLADPAAPTERHHLPSSDDSGFHNLDVKVDPRGGRYYRTHEPPGDHDGGDAAGHVEIVDFGFGAGSPEEPQLVGRFDSPHTHNLHLHPERPLVYATNSHDGLEHGVEVWAVDDPAAPERVGAAGTHGALHDVVVDAERGLLHCASNDGYSILDLAEPESPELLGRFRYDDHPDYEVVGEPGFESGHYASPDPERDLVVVGDELTSGVPGGKHVFDIGWGDGSPEDPRPVGFTHSPNARVREGPGDGLWTTHNHDVVPRGDLTLLVSGDYSEGVVLYDVTDPTEPEPLESYPTDDGADEVGGGDKAPRAWSATYSPERELVLASDLVTGVYTFEIADGE